MCAVVSADHSLTVNPLKLSPQMGAILAFLGLNKTVPILHGAQGCASFSKSLLTRHFREPIPLQTTALRQEQVILGGESAVTDTLQAVIKKQHPEMIGLITTALTETSGEDIDSVITRFRAANPGAPPIITVHTSDYSGSLSNGYVTALAAILDEVETWQREKKAKQLRYRPLAALVLGPTATPGDVDEIKELFAEFEFETIVLPDLSLSLDGHLGKGVFGTTVGGVTDKELARLKDVDFTFSFGTSVVHLGERIARWSGSPHFPYLSLNTLPAIDELVEFLSNESQIRVSDRLLRQRERYMDRMIDVHSYFSGQRIALAGEPDLLAAMEQGLKGLGAEVVAVFSPIPPSTLGYRNTWMVGDFDQLEQHLLTLPVHLRPQLLLSNSHGRQTARRLGMEFLAYGLPVWDRVGVPSESSVLYRGACQWITQLTNVMLSSHFDDIHTKD